MVSYMVDKFDLSSTDSSRKWSIMSPGVFFSCRPLPKRGQICDIPPHSLNDSVAVTDRQQRTRFFFYYCIKFNINCLPSDHSKGVNIF